MTDKPGSDFIADWVASGAGPTVTPGALGLLHRIPSGNFVMGSRFHWREAPRREVFVGEFEIAHTPVTVGQYSAFLDVGAVNQRKWWSDDGWEWRQGGAQGWGRTNRAQPHDWNAQRMKFQNPVTGLTFYEAEAYCRWISDNKERLVRLPTEDEWEKAARGEDGRPWPWGDVFKPGQANTVEHGVNQTLPVGSFPEDISPYGAVDMAGNVQEWTSGTYRASPDELTPATRLHVARGGSWNDTGFGARTSFRHVYPPGYFFPFLGFRVVVAMR
jgi:formylglycine-generating enzyme required for sulfatase activity